MLKKYGFKRELEDLEDYESFYNDDSKKVEPEEEASDDESIHFRNEREKNFYKNGEDMDFVKYHKRVTRNYHNELHELIDSSKQTVLKGITSNHSITLNYVRLNRSSTVVNVWWSLQALPISMVSDEVRHYQAIKEKDWIEQEISHREKEIEA